MKATASTKALALITMVVFAAIEEGSAVVFHPAKCETICSDESEIEGPLQATPDLDDGNRALQWSIILLNQIRDNLNELSPPGVARSLAIFATCLHDAIAANEKDMRPAYAVNAIKRDPDIIINQVINGAAYHAIDAMFHGKPSFQKVYQFLLQAAGDRVTAFELNDDFLFRTRGFLSDTEVRSFMQGRIACGDVIEAFTKDGFSPIGEPITEFKIDYRPVNDPQVIPGITDCAVEMKSMDHWQPLCVPDEFLSKTCTVQQFLGVLAGKMTTFGIANGESVLPKNGPPLVDGGDKKEWKKQAEQVLEFSAALNDTSKLIAEHWADGPDTTFPPGHLFRIGMGAAKKQGSNIIDTVKILFLVGTALNDAGVGAWGAKVNFDSIRPLQMIQCGYAGKVVDAWKGPYLGVGEIEASNWQPYQATTFVTPPFAGFVSGHSTFSAAAVGVLKEFFSGNDYLAPKCRKVAEGSSLFEGKINEGEDGFVSGLTDVANSGPKTTGYVPAEDVVLCWETFDESALDAGISRLHGGIHIMADHTHGSKMGFEVANKVYKKASTLWSNT